MTLNVISLRSWDEWQMTKPNIFKS